MLVLFVSTLKDNEGCCRLSLFKSTTQIVFFLEHIVMCL